MKTKVLVSEDKSHVIFSETSLNYHNNYELFNIHVFFFNWFWFKSNVFEPFSKVIFSFKDTNSLKFSRGLRPRTPANAILWSLRLHECRLRRLDDLRQQQQWRFWKTLPKTPKISSEDKSFGAYGNHWYQLQYHMHICILRHRSGRWTFFHRPNLADKISLSRE